MKRFTQNWKLETSEYQVKYDHREVKAVMHKKNTSSFAKNNQNF